MRTHAADAARLLKALGNEQRLLVVCDRRGGKKLAVATVHRDMESLRAEVDFERMQP